MRRYLQGLKSFLDYIPHGLTGVMHFLWRNIMTRILYHKTALRVELLLNLLTLRNMHYVGRKCSSLYEVHQLHDVYRQLVQNSRRPSAECSNSCSRLTFLSQSDRGSDHSTSRFHDNRRYTRWRHSKMSMDGLISTR